MPCPREQVPRHPRLTWDTKEAAQPNTSSVGKPFILVAPDGTDCCAARVLRKEGLVVRIRFLLREPLRSEEVSLPEATKWLSEKDLLHLIAWDALAAGGFCIRQELRVTRDSFALLSAPRGTDD